MPSGLFLFEIDETFGPKIISEYLLEGKLIPEALKILAEKHERGLADAICKKEDIRYYSSVISSNKIDEDIYLGFILNVDEDVVSLKSLFEDTEKSIAENFNKKDKKIMQDVLRLTLESIMSLLDKLKEPKIIQDKINEKTKIMLDEGRLKEAKELIGLGESIPAQLSNEVKQAEQFLRTKNYKKAKKSFQSSAELAKIIQEKEMVSFLQKKAEHVGMIPDILKERESLLKEVEKMGMSINSEELKTYPKLIPLLDNTINKASSLQEDKLVELLSEVRDTTYEASEIAKTLYALDRKIKQFLKKI